MRQSYTQPTQQRAWGDLTPAGRDTRYRQRGAIEMAEAGEPVFACAGPLPAFPALSPSPPGTMEHDLLHYYLKEQSASALGMKFKTKWKNWEDAWRDRTPPMAPPANRLAVYDLLVGTPDGRPADRVLSRIPWNQLGYGWRKVLGAKKSAKSCSEVIRFFFDRYMKLDYRRRYVLLKNRSNDYDDARARGACKILVKRLRAHKPTSIALCWDGAEYRRKRRSLLQGPAKGRGWHHVLGVVAGDTSGKSFLALEPWPGNASSIKYNSADTTFLAVIQYNPAKGALEYANWVRPWSKPCVLVVHAF